MALFPASGGGNSSGKGSSFADALSKATSAVVVMGIVSSGNNVPLVIPKDAITSSYKTFNTGIYSASNWYVYLAVQCSTNGLNTGFPKLQLNGSLDTGASFEYYYM